MRRFAHSPLPAVGETCALSDEAAHHFRDVLRGREGETVALFDGNGAQAQATVTHISRLGVQIQVQSVSHETAQPERVIVVSVLKGPAMDTAIRMATEAAATTIRPVFSARSVAKGDRSERWNRIARTAAQQCGRASIPTVHPPQPLCDVLGMLTGHTLYIAHPTLTATAQAVGDSAVLIGPEGGWTEAEVQLAMRHGALPLRLGPYVLRADTAVAVAAAWLAQPPTHAG